MLVFVAQRMNSQLAALVVALGLAAVLAFRVLLLTIPVGYPIYYSGPAILGYLILVGVLAEFRKNCNRWTGKEPLSCVAHVYSLYCFE